MEYALLLASIEARLEPKSFDCSRCAVNIKKEQNKRFKRKSKGCYDYKTKVYKIENILYRSCIGNYNINIGFLVDAFSKYEKAVLPFKGTLAQQPNKIIEIFNIIEQRREEKSKEG